MIETKYRYDIADPKYAEFIYHYCMDLYPEEYFYYRSTVCPDGVSMLEWIAYSELGRENFEDWLDEYFEANPELRP